jgi:hypothetical protein
MPATQARAAEVGGKRARLGGARPSFCGGAKRLACVGTIQPGKRAGRAVGGLRPAHTYEAALRSLLESKDTGDAKSIHLYFGLQAPAGQEGRWNSDGSGPGFRARQGAQPGTHFMTLVSCPGRR